MGAVPYNYECDRCGDRRDGLPALMGDIRESWFKTTRLGGELSDMGYGAGQTVTLCGGCLVEVAGKE